MKKQDQVKTKFGNGEIVAIEQPGTNEETYKVFVKNANCILSFKKNEIQEASN